MRINSIASAPAFKGLIVCRNWDGNNIAVNTKNIATLEEKSSDIMTSITLNNVGQEKDRDLLVRENFMDILKAYNQAARSHANVISVKSVGDKGLGEIME